MRRDLSEFLARHVPLVEEEAIWGEGTIRLRVRCYLAKETPPLDYVSSVRSLLLRGNEVMVLRNADDTHIYPGGRREDGETLEETLRREVLEEVGWEIEVGPQLGFVHFRHLTPEPEGNTFPYPDFLQVVYMAEAAALVPDARVEDDYELDAGFKLIYEVRRMGLSPGQLLFLEAALAERV